MSINSKAIAIAHEIADELAKRLSITVTEGFDTNGNPTILAGAASAGSTGAFIRVKTDWSDNSAQVDGLGFAQRVYTPHIVQVAFEANYAGATDNVADTNAWPVLLPVLGTVLARGAKTEVWLETYGSAPSVTTFDTANKKKAEFRDLYNPLLNQQ